MPIMTYRNYGLYYVSDGILIREPRTNEPITVVETLTEARETIDSWLTAP